MSQSLNLSYEDLQKINSDAKLRRRNMISYDDAKDYYIDYLKQEPGINAVTLCFSDIEGRYHMLDYDKDFLLSSYNNLTFDGSSIHGFASVDCSDLRVEPDWPAIYWLPEVIFSKRKVLMFANIKDIDGSFYHADMRSRLASYLLKLKQEKNYSTNIAVECEGFLLEGLNAEQNFIINNGFKLVSTGGYFNSLPKDRLRLFINEFADIKRAVGFENEKDHPEVAPSQFELNYKYTDALIAADQLQLYKMIARQLASNYGLTASFLPKPISGISGSGMHTNISIAKDGENIFYGSSGDMNLSDFALNFVDRLLYNANDLCLILNSSVNAYRRQNPEFEAPNQIKFSKNDRTSMIRVPLGNKKTARAEVRTIAPDVNPYMVFYMLLRVGLEGPFEKPKEQKRTRTRFLPASIQDAIKHFKSSEVIEEFLGSETKEKYLRLKHRSASRCPSELGKRVKDSEIIFHHEVTNQFLWNQF